MSMESVAKLRHTVHRGLTDEERIRAFHQLARHPDVEVKDFHFLLEVIDKGSKLYSLLEEALFALPSITTEALVKLALYGVTNGIRVRAFNALIERSDTTTKQLRLIAMVSSSMDTCAKAAELMLLRKDLSEEDLKEVSSRSNSQNVRHVVRRAYDEYISKRRPVRRSMK